MAVFSLWAWQAQHTGANSRHVQIIRRWRVCANICKSEWLHMCRAIMCPPESRLSAYGPVHTFCVYLHTDLYMVTGDDCTQHLSFPAKNIRLYSTIYAHLCTLCLMYRKGVTKCFTEVHLAFLKHHTGSHYWPLLKMSAAWLSCWCSGFTCYMLAVGL